MSIEFNKTKIEEIEEEQLHKLWLNHVYEEQYALGILEQPTKQYHIEDRRVITPGEVC